MASSLRGTASQANTLSAILVDILHFLDFSISLIKIVLINIYCAFPKKALSLSDLVTEMPQGVMQVLFNLATFTIRRDRISQRA